MTRIRCGHCGGSHATVAEVRSCHQSDGAVAAPTAAMTAAAVTSPATTAVEPTATGISGSAGPDALGRWLVVGPDGDVPAPWTEAPRFALGRRELAEPDDALEALEPLWLGRQRVVIELADDAERAGEPVEDRPPWELDPSFTFALDRLWHVVWSNSLDGRDATRRRWAWAERAIAAGARPAIGDVGDVVLPDGRVAWCDGGPLSAPPPGLTVLHRIAIERGRLEPLGAGPCLAALAPDQLAAVEHDGGAARIIAPAGSGKTRVLTERARHLLRTWQVPADALTLVAFNVRAADEMRERTTDLPGLQVRTLNALALAVLNGSGHFRSRGHRVATITERDVRGLLDTLVTFPRRANTDPAAVWIEALSAARLGLRDPREVEQSFGTDVPGFAEVFPRYRAALAERNQVDFDEQIIAAIAVLLTDPEARAAAQLTARMLLVDEFQDLAPAHLLLLRLLASPDLAVFGVGDDDQTIYGYAGATPEWLIGFQRLFPGAGEHPLHVNYRCPPAVVRAASHLLSHNRRRVPKEIHPGADRHDDPADLVVVTAADGTSATVDAVVQRVAAGAAPTDIAVLARVTASLAPVQVALRHHGVPVAQVVDAGYLERTGVRVALAWLRLASSPQKLRATDVDLTARRPSRGLSPKVVEWLAGCRAPDAIERLAGRLSNERDQDKVLGYLADLRDLARRTSDGAPTVELLVAVRARIGLDDALTKLDRSRADAQSTHIDDLDALVALAALHPEPASFASWLQQELAAPGDPDGVLLSSIHRVKGREWPHVVLHDVRDGVLPHRLVDDIEEERRVFHVGLTRCSRSVTVITDPARPSPLVAELYRMASAAPTVDPGRHRPSARAGTAVPAVVGKGAVRPAADSPLRDALKAWRGERAKTDAVPAYVVFTNVTLDALADLQPRTLDELRKIPGIGPAKRERYGQGIIDVVGSFTR